MIILNINVNINTGTPNFTAPLRTDFISNDIQENKSENQSFMSWNKGVGI